jgi:hypothetical protein
MTLSTALMLKESRYSAQELETYFLLARAQADRARKMNNVGSPGISVKLQKLCLVKEL